MSELLSAVDVVVVGAGTAGAAAALLCAQRGLRAACVDSRPLEGAGARWVNGIALWTFDEAGLQRPRTPELRADPGPAHLVAGFGRERVKIDVHEMAEVDMPRLVQRLQREAAEAGATVVGDVRVEGWDGRTLHTSRGKVRASWVVDASGLAGARLLAHTAVPAEHLCAAAQEVRRISDLPAARGFFERHGIPWGDAVSFTGVAGGYSLLHLRAHGDEMGVLAGSIPALGHPGGAAILQRFVAEQPWLGERLFGGSRAIPLRRPFERLAHERVAVLGDAACQVYSPTGSGIGAGFLAARLLADSLAAERGVLGYELDWHRRHGALFASVDLFRRFSQTLSFEELRLLMASGLLDASPAADSLNQRPPRFDPRVLARLARAVPRAPRMAARLGPVLARMAAMKALYGTIPRAPEKRRRWSRVVAALFGEASEHA